MRASRGLWPIVVLAVMAGLSTLAGSGAGADPPPVPFRWLAAGDSYSAGEGVGDDAQRCQISLFAYPRQVARGYGDPDDAWRQLFGDQVPARTSDTVDDIWSDDLDAPIVATRTGAYRSGTVEIVGRDGRYSLDLGTFRDFWSKRSKHQTLDVDQEWVACSGARTEDLFAIETDRPPQLTPGERYDLVTFSMGGNDLGFSTILNDCLGRGAKKYATALTNTFWHTDCPQTLEELKYRADLLAHPDDADAAGRFDPEEPCSGELTRHVDALPASRFRCSLADNGQIAGNPAYPPGGPDRLPGVGMVDVYAHIALQHLRPQTGALIVVGYPRFFASEAERNGCGQFTAKDVKLLNDGAEYLDQTLREAVADANKLVAGDPIHYLSVLAAFDDNGLCGDSEDWLNGVNLDFTDGAIQSDSFHPTRAGHDGMATLLRAAIERLCGFRVYREGRPASDCAAEDQELTEPSLFGASSSSTVLVLDVSDSMNDASPVGPAVPKITAAVQAGQDLIDVVRVDATGGFSHTVGLVSFNDAADQVLAATSDLDVASARTAQLVADGATNLGAGLDLGLDTVLDQAQLKRIVLLSDGDITEGLAQDQVLVQVVSEAERRKIRIDVVGFASSGSLDEDFLRAVATRTGGTFSLAASVQELRRDFIRARHAATGTVMVDATGTLDPSSGQTLATFDVPAGTSELVVSLGNEAELEDLVPRLRDPLGRLVPPAQTRVVGGNPVTVALRDPIPGAWTVVLDAEPAGRRAGGAAPAATVEPAPIWQPPVDGPPAGAAPGQGGQGSASGTVPYVLVVSTRVGAAPPPDVVAVLPGRPLSILSAVMIAAVALSSALSLSVLTRRSCAVARRSGLEVALASLTVGAVVFAVAAVALGVGGGG